jgi:hypothetical protein
MTTTTKITKEYFFNIFKTNNFKDFVYPTEGDTSTQYFILFRQAFEEVYFEFEGKESNVHISSEMLDKCKPIIVQLDVRSVFFEKLLIKTCSYNESKQFNFCLSMAQSTLPYQFLEMKMSFFMEILTKSAINCFCIFIVYFMNVKVNRRVDAWQMDAVTEYKFIPFGSFLQTAIVACIYTKLYNKLEEIINYTFRLVGSANKKRLPLNMIEEMYESRENIWYLHKSIADNYEELMLYAHKHTKIWITQISKKESSMSTILQSRIDGWKKYTDKIKSLNIPSNLIQDLFKYEITPFLIGQN